MRFALPALLSAAVLFAPVPALADETTGEIAAYDRVSNILVLKDKTIWEIQADAVLSDELERGDMVKISYDTAGEDGLLQINSITRIEG